MPVQFVVLAGVGCNVHILVAHALDPVPGPVNPGAQL